MKRFMVACDMLPNANGLPRRTQTRILEAGACPAFPALRGSALYRKLSASDSQKTLARCQYVEEHARYWRPLLSKNSTMNAQVTSSSPHRGRQRILRGRSPLLRKSSLTHSRQSRTPRRQRLPTITGSAPSAHQIAMSVLFMLSSPNDAGLRPEVAAPGLRLQHKRDGYLRFAGPDGCGIMHHQRSSARLYPPASWSGPRTR
jgi:hypothetical protein